MLRGGGWVRKEVALIKSLIMSDRKDVLELRLF